MSERKRILSGITPSGILTIGHLTGALTNWNKMQREFESFFMIADLHAITLRQTPKDLRSRTLDTAAMFLAAGIDPEESVMFTQSHVPAHSQLAWVMSTFTGMGEAERMTQFKDKSSKNSDNVNVGLLSYPILMACDILLYQANAVPVGQDQKQHLELTRNLAQRFNHHYSDTFAIPEPYIPEVGAKIMSLQEPTAKMSKSDPNQNATIFLTDDNDTVVRKIKRSVTDSGSEVKPGEGKEGIENLITLMTVATGKSTDEIVAEYEGEGYGKFKGDVAEAVAEYLAPIRKEFEKYREDKKFLTETLKKGDEKANKVAFKTLSKVYKKVGFLQY